MALVLGHGAEVHVLEGLEDPGWLGTAGLGILEEPTGLRCGDGSGRALRNVILVGGGRLLLNNLGAGTLTVVIASRPCIRA